MRVQKGLKMKKIFSIFGLLLLCGCGSCCRVSTDYKIDFTNKSKPISTKQSLYIALPEDAVYRTKTYPQSGKAIQRELYDNFSLKSSKVDNAFTLKSEKDSLQEAKINDIDLLVVPKITYWEDRTTTWSGKPDKGEIVVDIINVKTSENISRAQISAEGPKTTFVNYHPDHWLGKAIKEYVQKLYDNSSKLDEF